MNKLKRHSMVRVFEGFAGYGGASFGLQRAGIKHEIVGYSEFDKFASALYDANHRDKNGRRLNRLTRLNRRIRLTSFGAHEGQVLSGSTLNERRKAPCRS